MKNITNGPAYSHWKSRLLIVIGRVINKALYWTFFMLPEGSRAVAVSHILGELKLHYVKKLSGDRNLIFFSPSFKPLHRGQTVLSIQPEVPVWIDSFLPNSTFWDIGANIGAYTLYAGLREDMNIVAFEPGSANYYVLSKNIELNSQHHRTSAYCIALSDKSTIGHLTMQQSAMGAAHNAFGDPRDSWDHPSGTDVVKQGAISFSIDELVYKYNMAVPNYIKIDVDGIEDKILCGATKTMKDLRVKSICLEMQDYKPDENRLMLEILSSHGFVEAGNFGLNFIFTRP